MTDHPLSQQETRYEPSADRRLSPPVLVDSPRAFRGMLEVLAGEPMLALDTESNSLYRYYYRVCLIQISTLTADYLVDPLRLSDLAPLGRLLADPAVEKVFHAAENDVLMLKRDFGFSFANLFDTMLAARILGWPQVSLAALLAQHFDVRLDKRTQLTDWGRRPLTPAQLSYARLDSHFLLPLRDLLLTELQSRKRWREAQEVFAALPSVVYVEKPFDPDGFWRIRGARDLNQGELAILRELYLWRDEQARKLDRPPFKVIGRRCPGPTQPETAGASDRPGAQSISDRTIRPGHPGCRCPGPRGPAASAAGPLVQWQRPAWPGRVGPLRPVASVAHPPRR